MSVPRSEWRWFGHAAHFICALDCRFHLATAVGPWLISTVGEYMPDSAVRETMAEVRGIALEGKGDMRRADWMEKVGFEEIGVGRKYETMVFRFDKVCDLPDCGCGLPMPESWTELDADGYNTAKDATEGHYAMCERWAEKSTEQDTEQ